METVTLLLVEDEALLLLEFEQTLTNAGFDIVTATGARDAMRILNAPTSPIHGVVTDIRLGAPPDGWDIARTAREIDPQIPVVYVSGDSVRDWASKGVPNSVMLEKPFAMAQLVTAISQLLNDTSTSQPSAN
uniref:response regulator n=1 Tax=Sinorhizobium chiapasense TaxID=501572 RepID=UPI002FDF0EE7